MYSSRPAAYRIYRAAPATCTRNMSLFPRMVSSEFAPVFRLMEDFHAVASRNNGFNKSFRSFQPRFDVKESKDSYELQGEFPGFEQKDITIEFTDANTLSIKGRRERYSEEGTRPSAQVEAQSEQPQVAENTETAESETNSYHKASVEDEFVTDMSGANPDATPAETPAESVAATETPAQEVAPAPKNESRYWVSERSVGEFSRTFSFANRVDHENVKASLDKGLLSVLIPKAAAPQSRRINIE